MKVAPVGQAKVDQAGPVDPEANRVKADREGPAEADQKDSPVKLALAARECPRAWPGWALEDLGWKRGARRATT